MKTVLWHILWKLVSATEEKKMPSITWNFELISQNFELTLPIKNLCEGTLFPCYQKAEDISSQCDSCRPWFKTAKHVQRGFTNDGIFVTRWSMWHYLDNSNLFMFTVHWYLTDAISTWFCVLLFLCSLLLGNKDDVIHVDSWLSLESN